MSDRALRASTMVELLRVRAEQHCDDVSHVFLTHGDVDGPAPQLSYGELTRRAMAIAATLQSHGAESERALLVYPPGFDFIAGFFGCLFANVIAVPAYPPDLARLDRSLTRLSAIARDSGARFILTLSAFKEMAQGLETRMPELARLTWIATDEVGEALAVDWREPSLRPESTAFLQYTSGSTSTPKGVIISHRNLLANSAAIYHLAQHHRDSVYVSWLPSYHDMGLIGGILQPIYAGMRGVLLSPMAFLERPSRWLRAISHYRGTTSPFPNFALDLCVRKFPRAERAGLDLRSWRLACNGAEPIRHESLVRFTQEFSEYGFRHESHYPAYGLAESTLLASGGELGRPPRQVEADAIALRSGTFAATSGPLRKTLMGCGSAPPEHEICIADSATATRVPDGIVGEIWFRGPSVAGGYWNRPEQSRETFGARLADAPELSYLRTGDLGFLLGGELFVTGRQKDLIITRGQNLYPEDIEVAVERCSTAVRAGCVAAFGLEAGLEQGVAIALEVTTREPVDLDALISVVREAVARELSIRLSAIVLLRQGGLPKTSSGKLQRHVCSEEYASGRLRGLKEWVAERAPANKGAQLDRNALLKLELDARTRALTDYLVSRLADALGVDASELDPSRRLSEIGIDSLTGVSLHGKLERSLQVSIPISLMLGPSGIAGVAKALARKLGPTGGRADDPDHSVRHSSIEPAHE